MSRTDTKPNTPLGKWMAENDRDDAAVAAALNIGRTQANRLRRGVSKPSLKTAKALERLTNIDAFAHLEGALPAQDVAA